MGPLEKLTNRAESAKNEVMRKAKNHFFKRGDLSEDRYWDRKDTPALKIEDITKNTPKEVWDKLKAIEECCGKPLRRPHEWLSNDGEKRLTKLRDNDPSSVHRYLRQYSSIKEEQDLDKKKRDLKELEDKIEILDRDRRVAENRIANIKDVIANSAMREGQDTLKQNLKQWEQQLELIKDKKVLQKIPLLAAERYINQIQVDVLTDEKVKIDNVNGILKERTTANPNTVSSMLGYMAFEKETTWSKVQQDAEKISRDLQAKIDRRKARITKINTHHSHKWPARFLFFSGEKDCMVRIAQRR